MTKTQNYSLPQWEADDPVKREDFNDAMEKIDGALAKTYTTDRRPAEVVHVTVPDSHAAGDVLLELDYEPVFAFLCNSYATKPVSNGRYCAMYVASVFSEANCMWLHLQSNKLTLYSAGENLEGNSYTLTVALFR